MSGGKGNMPVRSAAAPTVFYSAFYSKDMYFTLFILFLQSISVAIIAMANHGLLDYCS